MPARSRVRDVEDDVVDGRVQRSIRSRQRILDALVELVEEGFDLAFRLGPQRDSSLLGRRLGTGRISYVASPGYLEVRGEPGSPDDLAAHDCIAVGRGPWARWSFLTADGVQRLQIEPRVVANDLDAVRTAAIAGVGIAWMPSF